jgi:hypothetical protein
MTTRINVTAVAWSSSSRGGEHSGYALGVMVGTDVHEGVGIALARPLEGA